MPELKSLLVATDFSAAAGHAIARAGLIARQSDACLNLLHVRRHEPLDALRRLADGNSDDGADEQLAARVSLRQQAALLAHDGIACSWRIACGPLIGQLAAQARALPADLVVLGFCGASLMRHFLLGSTAERMVTQAFCPLLVVKKAAAANYRSLLVAVDFSPLSLPVLERARELAPDAEIVVQHVFSVPFEGKLQYAGVDRETIHQRRIAARRQATSRLVELCEAACLPPQQVRLLISDGQPAQQIVSQQQRRRCDLIVIGKQGDNALENLLIGSVTRQVIAKAECDVLITV